MRFDIITLFPEIFAPFLTSGITRRAFESGQVDVKLANPRDFASGNYRRVDDRPFGGGPGMVMLAEPLTQCLKDIQTGEYAKSFILENKAGAPTLLSRRRLTSEHQIEKVGEKLRAMMPWIKKNKLVDQTRN